MFRHVFVGAAVVVAVLATAWSATAAAPDKSASLPTGPAARLERADDAFQDADYHLLEPLLEPMLVPTSQFETTRNELAARTLLGVGLYFEAQQVTDADRRNQLLSRAKTQFLELLRNDPDHAINPLIYPASVVELFEAVKAENADELDALRAATGPAKPADHPRGLQSVYIEREVGLHNYAINFVPFGLGQFQNKEPVQGTLFATSQALALGLNVASYWMIESLREDDGYYTPGPGEAAASARNWRIVQYGALGAFVGLYVWSLVDALRDYTPSNVHIRTLDEPPPELSAGADDEVGPSLRFGLGGIGMAW